MVGEGWHLTDIYIASYRVYSHPAYPGLPENCRTLVPIPAIAGVF